MLPDTIHKLEKIKIECKKMVTKRAAMSGLAVLVPIPGTDIAADIGMLMELLPAINQRFGLTQEQIGQLEDKTKIMLMEIAKKMGARLVGRVITADLIIDLMTKIAGNYASQQVLKYIPVAGQLTAAALSFAAMKYLGNSHVEECFRVVQRVLDKKAAEIRVQAAATSNGTIMGGERQNIIETIKALKGLMDEGIIDEEEFRKKKNDLISRL
jgi:uncharacterized protein (DUF697 family)